MSEPSIEPLREWRASADKSFWMLGPKVDQALAAYDLMSQRAERLEGAWRVHIKFIVEQISESDCSACNQFLEGIITHARTVLSENKEEKL